MSQVEGGDLLVIQRGSEATHASDLGSGWSDGPWWRQADVKRDIGAVRGLAEGTKLARVGAESYATEFFAARGGVEAAARQATQVLSESNPVRSSNIFLAVQAVSYAAPKELFAGSHPAGEKKADGVGEGGGGIVQEEDEAEELMAFAIYLHDPIHSLAFSTLSQSFPAKWVHWLDASAPSSSSYDPDHPSAQLPPEILTIIEEGGVDPREWISEWIEETISLAVGIVAQRYVARRMGVGEGGIGRGKARATALEEGGGEAARAI